MARATRILALGLVVMMVAAHPAAAWSWSLPTFNWNWQTASIPNLFPSTISLPSASLGSYVTVTVKNPKISWAQSTITINSGSVVVSPGVSLDTLGIKLVSANGGVALVVYDPSVQLTVNANGISYNLGFSKTWFGTYNIVVSVFGVPIALIPLPSYGYTLQGMQVSGVLKF